MSLIPLAYMCMYSDLLKGFGGFSVCVYWQDVPLDTGGGRSYCLIVPLWCLCEAAMLRLPPLPIFTAGFALKGHNRKYN